MKKRAAYKLIYNPGAGSKRRVAHAKSYTLEDIKTLLKKYQIPVDLYPSKSFAHLLELSKNSIREGYRTVIAAGGDGTVGQVANGLVLSDVSLGILPFGTFMNTARMLSIPSDIEQAIMMIKIGRERRIDVGRITKLNGDKLAKPSYFLESAGIGLEAIVHGELLHIDKEKFHAIGDLIKAYIRFYQSPVSITIDGKEITTNASMVSISNGPFCGPAFKLAPKAKLNDHKLTVVFFHMNKWELMAHFTKVILKRRVRFSKIKTFQGETVKVDTGHRVIHADARVFGEAPAEFKIIPSALSVITGFPNDDENLSLNARTELDP
jgi:diacylglycerol kinase (ATP)